MAIIHRIGTPENDSETRAIKRLAKDLSDDYFVFHNFELTTGRGLPYEYDIAVLSPHALYHLEVKGYHGEIRGNPMQWTFENGGVFPSPIPLANKKTKILAGKLKQYSHRLEGVFVETLILLTEDRARAKLKDDQAGRVIHLRDAIDRLSDPKYLPVSTGNVSALADMVCEALFTTRPAKKVQQIGLYDIVEKLDQDDRFTIFLARHRFIQTQPLTVLKVYHLDVYATADEKQYRIREIFHSHDAMRLLGMHPNLVRCGDMFTWNDDSFVEPVGTYIKGGQLLEWLLDKGSERALTWDEKTRIIKGVAAGLAHAHKHGVIHRDVRPVTSSLPRARSSSWGTSTCRSSRTPRTSALPGRSGSISTGATSPRPSGRIPTTSRPPAMFTRSAWCTISSSPGNRPYTTWRRCWRAKARPSTSISSPRS
jgi:hypothetical protein